MSTAAPLQALAAKSQSRTGSAHGGLMLQRKCACGSPTASLTGDCSECKTKKTLQPKLAIGASNDPLEQEADRVAEQVLAAPANRAVSVAPPRIQRFTGHVTGEADTAPGSVDRVLASPGRPLEPALRQDMEHRFAHDFSRVRVHSGFPAAQSAREVNAHAYTVGHDIVFDAGQYAPESYAGRRLIAHELTHVVQQSDLTGLSYAQGRASSGPSLAARGLVILRQSSGPSTRRGVTMVTDFHPGVAHNHAPTGRWGEIQKDADSRCQKLTAALESEVRKGDKADPKKVAETGGLAGIECSCANLSPDHVMRAAGHTVMLGLPLAQKHLDHYLNGGGADFFEDIEDVIKRDSGIRSKLAAAIGRSKKGSIRIEQSDYTVKDFQYAFGAIDRLDYEVNSGIGQVHVWFMDRYEWHPVGFGYKLLAGDSRRETNCVHAAAVELKTSGAADYWMVGDGVISLSAVTSRPASKAKP